MSAVNTVEDAENQQRHEALGRRRHVVDRAERVLERERRAQPRFVPFEIGQRQQRAGGLKIARDTARKIAAVEIVEARIGQMFERRGDARRDETFARLRRAAVMQKGIGETGDRAQFGEPACDALCLAACDRHAMLRIMNRVLEQPPERQRAAERVLRPAMRKLPARHGARDGIGGERTARGNRRESARAVLVDGGGERSRPTRLDPNRFGARTRDQPEAVAADAVHMRIHDSNGRGSGDHRFDCVAAFAQDG
jgi:hypothetical protein